MIETSESIGALAAALAAAQAEMKAVRRNREVTVRGETKAGKQFSYKFKYATFDDIMDAVRGPLAKNGLAVSQLPSGGSSGGLILTTILLHSSGEWIRAGLPIQVDGRGLQEVGSALTYAKRYALSAMLGVASEEDDDGNAAEGNQATFGSPRQQPQAQPRRAAPAQPAHDPQTGEVHDDPVAAWCRKATEEINNLRSQEAVNEWEDTNKATLARLAEKDPDARNRIGNVMAERWQALDPALVA